MSQTVQKLVPVEHAEWMQNLFGLADDHARMIKQEWQVDLIARENSVVITGSPDHVNQVEKLVNSLMKEMRKGQTVTPQTVRYLINLIRESEFDTVSQFAGETVTVTVKGKMIKAKTVGQGQYVHAMAQNELTFGIGPAGTGKTYLAVAMAVKAFGSKEVDRIILTRPALEAGESLGFLPGDLKDKIDPYLRPLYDSLFDIIGVEKFQKYMERGLIEVAPLAYMRGRTLDHAYVILDEAQNTTREQMKMFLTRLGVGSKAVVTGDITQIDLPRGKSSGLVEALKIVSEIDDIGVVHLSDKDVVRHRLVQQIIRAYADYENRQNKE